MTAAIKILAIVGRPNVGKSTLFNRIVGRPLAITHQEPGVTRDRVSAVARWQGKTFEVVDTGGIAFLEEESARDPIAAAMIHQAEIAMEQASVIVMVTDVTEGVTPLDRDLARRLRAWGKPVLVAVNKVDSARRETAVGEFAELGFDPVFPIAAAHGTGVSALLEAATADFPTQPESESMPTLRLAIVGKPNAGKSSLINAILQSERTIVSEIPGTTRDAVHIPFTWEGRQYVLVDTAGLRHRRKIRSSVEQFSLMRAERSIRECDVAVLVLDAAAGVTKQDKCIGGLIAEARCG
ncbi:MAG: ribosome biogenesis GTPase Der, partial [Verrucomicrobiae bacterium]|nr:ribosome biogenesis GTPase Der [Verrucomicrobiae bacterium]